MSKIYVVGIGPGSGAGMTQQARDAIGNADIIVGYSTYIALIREEFKNKEFASSGMRQEVERCREALQLAEGGKNVALVSSGDSGIYGMAGVMLEVRNREESSVEIEIIPGVTSASASAAILGAPLMHDFAVISLSDYLTTWDKIAERLEMASKGDFVICLYNPKSKARSGYINIARDIMLKYKSGDTPVGIVRNAGREDQKSQITTLEDMLSYGIDMFTTIIVGNSNTYVANGQMITPRGYEI